MERHLLRQSSFMQNTENTKVLIVVLYRCSINQSETAGGGCWGARWEGKGEGGAQGHRGGGVKFDGRSQLAPSIQDALGWTGRGAEGARQR